MKLVAYLLLLTLALCAQKVQELCTPCHVGPSQEFDTHPHKDDGEISCDTCHGASVKHRETEGQTPPERIAGPSEIPALCGKCHKVQHEAYLPSKHYETLLARVAGKRAPNCVTCHSSHAPRSISGIFVQCQRCHDPLPATCKPASCATCHNSHSSKVKK